MMKMGLFRLAFFTGSFLIYLQLSNAAVSKTPIKVKEPEPEPQPEQEPTDVEIETTTSDADKLVFCSVSVTSTWMSWSEWSHCTDDCGSCGTQSRVRHCLTLSTDVDCKGNFFETQNCNTEPCTYPRQFCCKGFHLRRAKKYVECKRDGL